MVSKIGRLRVVFEMLVKQSLMGLMQQWGWPAKAINLVKLEKSLY